MKATIKAAWTGAALIALSLLAGCGQSTSPTAPPSSSASNTAPEVASSAAPPERTASAPLTPLLRAASYPPRDECNALPGWPEFRTKLEQAVAKRDADALAALTDPGVKLDFGGGGGIKEMRVRLRDKDYKLWDEIAALLPLGCAADESGATMPWIFAKAPDDVDAYSGMLVLGSAVPAYAKPSADSQALATLNWAMVTVEEYQGENPPFTKVTLPGGKTAFVETAKLRSIIDYRLLASHTRQGWRIDGLVAGD